MDFSTMLLLAGLFVAAKALLLVRGSGRRTLRRAWTAIHAGQVERGRRLLQPLLASSRPRRREPARIALLAAARVAGDETAMRALVATIDRSALSRQNRRVLGEEEVRVLVALGETAEAVRVAEGLLGQGTASEQHRARELFAYALLADGRHGTARRVLEELLGAVRSPRQAPQRAWALYQLGLLRRLERCEGAARQLLLQAAAESHGGTASRLAAQALREGETPDRL